jgi:hypothetical protein
MISNALKAALPDLLMLELNVKNAIQNAQLVETQLHSAHHAIVQAN